MRGIERGTGLRARHLPRMSALLLAAGTLLAACGGEPPPANAEPEILITAPDMAPAVDTTAMTRTPSGLYYEDLVEGDGEVAQDGLLANVHYSGWLLDAGSYAEWTQESDKFDATLDHQGAETFGFQLGRGMVIRGWDEGVVGMKVGGVRRLVIPPELAYGPGGRPPIPPNATLIFDVQLVRLSTTR